MTKARRITELDGLRVIMIFIVSWFHIWQQSWLEPVIPIPGTEIRWSLDWLVRSGYVWVDGTVLLSAFLLYLPLARKGRSTLENVPDFFYKKAKRLLPGFWFIIIVFFLGMCVPFNLYGGDGPYIVKDLFTHFTLIFPFWRDTYIYTPLGAAPWTLSIVAQGYLLFPLLAKAMKKKPACTLIFMVCAAFGFRAWCIWGMSDYSMVVNTLANFLDVYAAGFGAAMLYAWMEKKPGFAREKQEDKEKRKRQILTQIGATIVFFGCLVATCEVLKYQAATGAHNNLQKYQMMLRPIFALGFGGMILSAPFMVRPLRFLLGNRVMVFLSSVSMSYYLIHQTLAVHLKRLNFPPAENEYPNMAGEQPWQWQYTLACFGFSLLAAIFVTYVIEKPVGKWMDKRRARK